MANPIIERAEMAIGGRAMTVKGTVQKTSFLLALTATSGLGLFFYALSVGMASSTVFMMLIASAVITCILGITVVFKPLLSKAIAIPYALFEGISVGSISIFAMKIYPAVPATAICATFVTATLMLGLYRTGIIKVTNKFRSIMTSAMAAIMILYIIQLVMRFAFGSSIPFLFDGGIIAIGFSIFVIIIASFSLLLDFNNIERGVAMGISEEYEWLYSIGILARLVWMYIEFVRLLGYLAD